MPSCKSKFGLFTLAFLLGSASVRAQLPPETTQPPATGEDSTIRATLAEPQQPAPTPAAGTVRENPKDGLKYVWIPPGTFMMGCSPGDNECFDREKPSHQVTITKGFWMGQTEVTVGAYQRFAAATSQEMPQVPPGLGFKVSWANQNIPVVTVNWDEAQAYCQWAGGRLPTEAEWEYAARGGSTQSRYGDLDKIAWYYKNSGGGAHEVAQKQANGFALYDTLGNVSEWVNDWYDPNYYRSSPSSDPAGPATGRLRVVRGGSWYVGAGLVRVSFRVRVDPAEWVNLYGLRCVEEASAP